MCDATSDQIYIKGSITNADMLCIYLHGREEWSVVDSENAALLSSNKQTGGSRKTFIKQKPI